MPLASAIRSTDSPLTVTVGRASVVCAGVGEVIATES